MKRDHEQIEYAKKLQSENATMLDALDRIASYSPRDDGTNASVARDAMREIAAKALSKVTKK